jgi:hypothetical protein
MTYEVLNKVSKKELISWMKNNVFLPDISDEEFLREIKLESLFAKEKELLAADKRLNEKLEKATADPVKFLQLMTESSILNNQIEKINKEIAKLLYGKESDS